MMGKMEELVDALNRTNSAWDLMNQIPLLKEGLADLLVRLQNLERVVRNLRQHG